MAATEEDIIRDEQERSNLLRAIADVETAIAVSTPGTRRVLENTLDNAKKRGATLDKRIEEAKVERRAEEQAEMAIAALAAKETALNTYEREQYSGFLKEEFFTKKDFGKLAQFYSHAYDRLSEGGKDEMSHRVWEGIRHGEYRFDDLPDEVKEKEAKLAYKKLTALGVEHDSLMQAPEADRDDFLKAYERGNRDETYRALNRDGFRQNMSLQTSAPITHRAATAGNAAKDEDVLAANSPKQNDAAAKESSAMNKINFDAGSLNGLAVADSPSAPSAAAIPNGANSRSNARSPV